MHIEPKEVGRVLVIIVVICCFKNILGFGFLHYKVHWLMMIVNDVFVVFFTPFLGFGLSNFRGDCIEFSKERLLATHVFKITFRLY